MNDLIDALKTRLNSPVFGYFGLALLAFNWQGFFYLFVQDGNALNRIEYFEQHTTIYSIVISPLSFSLAFAVLYPWILFGVASVTAKPTELKDSLQAKSEHKILLMRKHLEEARTSLLANAEFELLERAKRDQELNQLQSEELREKLRSELDQLRFERDSLRESNQPSSARARHKELMDIAGDYRKRAGESQGISDKESFIKRAREMEEQAHDFLMQSNIMGEQNA